MLSVERWAVILDQDIRRLLTIYETESNAISNLPNGYPYVLPTLGIDIEHVIYVLFTQYLVL